MRLKYPKLKNGKCKFAQRKKPSENEPLHRARLLYYTRMFIKLSNKLFYAHQFERQTNFIGTYK